MRVDLDAKVRTRDGEPAGSVQRAVIDPQANEVTDFVISTGGLFGHDVLVPRERRRCRDAPFAMTTVRRGVHEPVATIGSGPAVGIRSG